MAYYLAELYSPKPAWHELSGEQHQQFFNAIGAGMAQLAALGIEVIAMGETIPGKSHAAQQQFFALWKLPDETALDALLDGIAASGWHDYFATVNAAGAGTDLAGHLQQLAAPGKAS